MKTKTHLIFTKFDPLLSIYCTYSHGQKYRHPCNSVRKCNTSLRKLFQLQMFWYSCAYCFCLHCNNTKQQRRKVKLDQISHRTQKWTGQNDWHLVKIVRNSCFSSMWCSCNLYLDKPVASNRCSQYSNHTCNQFKWRNGDSTFVLCVTLSMEKRKKCKKLSVDLREKIVEKHGQSQDYKTISRDLNVPVSTVCNIINRFTAHGTVANLPERGLKSKINEKLQRRIVRMVDKEPRLTSKQIQADLQTQGTTVSAPTICRHLNEKGHYGRRPRRTPLLTQKHKKQNWSFPKLMWQKHNPSGRTYCGQMRQK